MFNNDISNRLGAVRQTPLTDRILSHTHRPAGSGWTFSAPSILTGTSAGGAGRPGAFDAAVTDRTGGVTDFTRKEAASIVLIQRSAERWGADTCDSQCRKLHKPSPAPWGGGGRKSYPCSVSCLQTTVIAREV